MKCKKCLGNVVEPVCAACDGMGEVPSREAIAIQNDWADYQDFCFNRDERPDPNEFWKIIDNHIEKIIQKKNDAIRAWHEALAAENKLRNEVEQKYTKPLNEWIESLPIGQRPDYKSAMEALIARARMIHLSRSETTGRFDVGLATENW
jgi:BMFP domain-containing protein YqiC